jgi:hypothetical protein
MSVNLSSTIPAAPAGGTNVIFQTDGQGNVSAYIQSATELIGDGVDLTAQTADIGPNTLVTTPNGYYRISAYLIVTTVDGASSTLPKLTITWNDLDSGHGQSFDITPTNTGNLLTTLEQSDMIVSAGSSATLDYATSGYTSGTPATMKFAIHIRVEQL